MSEVPIIYRLIHLKLLQQNRIVMDRRSIVGIVRRYVRLPKQNMHIDRKIIRELENFGFIEFINRKKGYKIAQIRTIINEPFF